MRYWIVFLMLPLLPAADEKPPEIQMQWQKGTARILSGSAGLGHLILQASGTEADLARFKTNPTAEPAATDSANVKFGEVEEIAPRKDGFRLWRLPVVTENLQGTGIFMRKVKITWDKIRELSFHISIPPQLELTLSNLPADWNAAKSRCISVRVFAKGTEATGVGITSTLTDTDTKSNLSSQLYLSLDGQSIAPQTALDKAVNETAGPLFLCIKDEFRAAGKFAGNLTVSATEKPSGASTSINIYNRTSSGVLLGSSVLLLGCLLAVLFRFLLPARVAHQQALLPAVMLLEHLKRLKAALAARPASATPISAIPGVLADSTEALSVDNLIKLNLIPSRFGILFRAPDAAAYSNHLNKHSARIEALQILIRDGIQVADKAQPPSPADKTKVDQIDALAAQHPFPTADAARQQVHQILHPPQPSAAPMMQPPGAPTSQDLIFSIDNSAQASAWMWAALSFISGYVVLILARPDFGVPMHYLYCLLWGFGISTASAINANPVQSTMLGIKIPGQTS